eukprot:14399848-Heterocapsa_arctica.AAC.1
MKRIENLIHDETGYIRDKIKDIGMPTDRAPNRAEEEEPEEGAMENNMTKQAEADVLQRLESNP